LELIPKGFWIYGFKVWRLGVLGLRVRRLILGAGSAAASAPVA
jgi:hypothetical protein